MGSDYPWMVYYSFLPYWFWILFFPQKCCAWAQKAKTYQNKKPGNKCLNISPDGTTKWRTGGIKRESSKIRRVLEPWTYSAQSYIKQITDTQGSGDQSKWLMQYLQGKAGCLGSWPLVYCSALWVPGPQWQEVFLLHAHRRLGETQI